MLKIFKDDAQSPKGAFHGGPQNESLQCRKKIEISIKTRPNKNLTTANQLQSFTRNQNCLFSS